MFLEQQQFWVQLVNTVAAWKDEEVLLAYVPERVRDFSVPPGWSLTRAFNYLLNNVDVVRTNHAALEAGRRLDYEMINHVLSAAVPRLIDWGDLEAIRARSGARARVGSRIETLVALSPKNGLNPGTVFVRNTVERAFFYFAMYADYRFSDPEYPGASPGKFQVKECLRSGCRKLFIRTPETILYCSEECARLDR